MKKILTVLLSFFMVATLGNVNVSAASYGPVGYDWCENNGDTKACYYNEASDWYYTEGKYNSQSVTIGRALSEKTTIKYNGEEQTLFTIKCNSGTCNFYYSLATKDDTTGDLSFKGWNQFQKSQGFSVDVKAKDINKYYLFLATNAGGTENLSVYTNTLEGKNERTVSIVKGTTNLSINAPTPSYEFDYSFWYVVTAQSGDVVLPFTITSDPEVNTKWNEAEVTMKDGTYNGGIKFESGNLTIYADNTNLSNGTYEVKLSATSDNPNYEGNAERTIYVVKADSNEFTINLNNNILCEGNAVYGVTASDVIDNIDSVYLNTQQIAPVEGKTTYLAKVEKLEEGNYVTVSNDDLLPISSNDDDYRISVEITHHYGDDQTYTYIARDNFKVVRKYANAKVDPSEGLVYNGEDQVLATASDVIPTDGYLTKGAKVYYKVSLDNVGEGNKANYENESLAKIEEVTEPTGKNADTYYVYYRVYHGTDANYQDSYGMVTVTIDKAPLTVMGLDDKTIPYDGERHEPDFDVDGFIKSEEPFDLKVFNPTDKDHRYKDAGDWTVTVKIPYSVEEGQADPNNYKLVDSEGNEVSSLSATLTIEKATAKVVAATSIYYKNNKGTATIKSNGLSGDFVALGIKKADGTWETVDENNYTVSKNGPTIIVLSEEYLQSKIDGKETFEIGKDYEFALAFNPDNYTTDPATTKLQVRKYTAPSSDSSSSSSSSSSTTTAKKVVNTSAN